MLVALCVSSIHCIIITNHIISPFLLYFDRYVQPIIVEIMLVKVTKYLLSLISYGWQSPVFIVRLIYNML